MRYISVENLLVFSTKPLKDGTYILKLKLNKDNTPYVTDGMEYPSKCVFKNQGGIICYIDAEQYRKLPIQHGKYLSITIRN